MRRTIAVIAVALLTLTAGCSGFAGTAGPNANPQVSGTDAGASGPGSAAGAGRTVAVAASGAVETDPDRAVVRVAVTARADSVETVREQLAENASRMRSGLEELGLDADQITSARYDLGQNYEHEDRPSAPAFQGQHAFVVSVEDPDRAGEVVVAAVQNGATRVEEVRFTIAEETRRDLREEALSEAVDNARGKASVAAEGSDLSLDGVRTVRTADVSTEPIHRESLAFASNGGAGDAAGTSFEGGSVTVTAEVTVVYEATGN